MKEPVRILSTRKLLPNQRQHLLHANFSVVEADFIAVQPISFSLPQSTFDAVIISSQHAVESILQHSSHAQIKTKPCFVVGRKTKSLLEQNGFQVSVYADSAAELSTIICEQYQHKQFVYFCGNLRRDELPQALAKAHITCGEMVVYQTTVTPQQISTKQDAVLFFSPSAVESFLLKNTISNQTCFCIGKTTAEVLEKRNMPCIVASQPSVEHVIYQCIKYYNPT